MVMPSSGPISADIINADFGYASGSKVELSKTPFCLAANAPADSLVSMNGFYYTFSGTQQDKIEPTAQPTINTFGSDITMSADGNTMVVSSHNGSTFTDFTNAACIYVRSGGVWTQQARLDLIGGGTNYYGAVCLSISSDGNTVVLGNNYDGGGLGAVWTFTRSGSTWTQFGSKLTPPALTTFFGIDVSLSSDGNTLAVGASGYNSSNGAVIMYSKGVSSWTQTDILTGTGNVGIARIGTSVALSSDGNTVVASGRSDNSDTGAIWVFRKSGGSWAQDGSKLVGSGYSGTDVSSFGNVVVSADGNTLAFSSTRDGTNGTTVLFGIGATWVFTRASGSWVQQGSKLVGTGVIGANAQQGFRLSLSADGNILAIGGIMDGYYVTTSPGGYWYIGATWMFTRTGTTWTQQSKLVGTPNPVGNIKIGQGTGLAMSGNGNTLAIGAPASISSGTQGAVYIYG